MRGALLVVVAWVAACGAMEAAPAPPDAGPADAAEDAPLVPGDAGPPAVDAAEADADAGWCPRSGACGVFAGDPQSDPHNCGACGHDCAGGACEAGVCVPLPAGVLATGQHDPVAVAVDDTNVYWLNRGTYVPLGPKLGSIYQGDGQLMTCAITGCDNHPTVLADLKNPAEIWVTPEALVLDADHVYWSDDGVQSCAKGGCACAAKTLTTAGALGVAVTPSSFFFTDYGHDVGTCPIGGCSGAPTLFTSAAVVGSIGITVDDASVYWTTENGKLFSCGLGGCTAPNLLWAGAPKTSQAATHSVFVDATNLYWTNSNPMTYGSVMQCAKSSCGSTLVMLANGRNGPNGVVADATNVYWAEGDIYACAIGGCNDSPTIAVTAHASAMAMGAHAFYWAEPGADPNDGRILFAAK